MGTDWATTAAPTTGDGQQWASAIISSTSDTDFKIASEAPEDIHLTFEQLDIMPQEIEGSEFYRPFLSSWAAVSDNKASAGLGGWATIIYGGGTGASN
jgi:hypothetical protein